MVSLLRSPSTERGRTREEEVARLSRGLKALSKELDVPVLALAQLSREADRADQGEPRLSHLRESGALEQDADVVLLLWRPSLHDSTVPRELVCLKVAKNRQGPTGQVDLRFIESQFRKLYIAKLRKIGWCVLGQIEVDECRLVFVHGASMSKLEHNFGCF